MHSLLIVLTFLLSLAAAAAEEQHAPADRLGRLFALAHSQATWKGSSLNLQMRLLRSAAERQKVVSDPVSDRYLITCYGGPIDLVHFLQLAADVEAGADPDARLWKEWQAEGGPHFVHWGFDRSEPPEAHPDDLPSNAFGALFGSEVRSSPPKDLEAALRGLSLPPPAASRSCCRQALPSARRHGAGVKTHQAGTGSCPDLVRGQALAAD